MIQQEYKNNVEDVSAQVQTTGFSIEVNESMFQMLTSNVYNDPVLAVIREWSTNACDACLEAGVEVKFDVHLPTLEEPSFSVRDFGTGLAPEDIVGLFSNLGASTKRNSNAYNGTLGIGRMAGLAVSNAFTVESFYKGTLHSYAISMQNGVPVTLHMGNAPTDEPNGLRLAVSVDFDDISDYLKKAGYLYKYFDHKPSLNRDDVDIHLSVEEHISDDWFIQKPKDHYTQTNYVVMSQVPYAIPDNHVVKTHGFRNLVIKAEPGSVSFNPGRESLSLNKETVSYLNDAFTRIADDYISSATVALANTKNDYELMKTYRTLTNTAPGQISQKINPSKFASSLFQNLFASPRYRMGPPSYSYVAPTALFEADTGNNLSMAFKSGYYKTSKPITVEYASDWSEFFNAHHVIVDTKTNFRAALNEQFRGKDLVTWQRVGKGSVEDAVAHAKRYLEELGISYKLSSDLVDPVAVKEAAAREGLYASSLVGLSMSKSTKMTKEEAETGKYLYLKTNNTTPDIPEGSKHSFDDYVAAYSLLQRAGVAVPVIKGVAKKYQSYVDDLPNWVDFQTYIEDTMASSTFKVPTEGVPASFLYNFINSDNSRWFPSDIRRCFKEWEYYKVHGRSNWYIADASVVELVKNFGSGTEAYEWAQDVDVTALASKYPKSFPILIGTKYFPRMDSEFLQYLTKLEEHYATRSSE